MEEITLVQTQTVDASPKVHGGHELKMRVYYSSYHLWAAKNFANMTATIEAVRTGFDIEHRTYATSAVLCSVAFMEAAINELFQDAADNCQSYIAPMQHDAKLLIESFWKVTEAQNRPVSILQKYQIVLDLCKYDAFPKGESLYQNAELVVKLRNELVHYKPQTLGGSDTHELEVKIKTRFAPNAMMNGSGNPFFPDKCLGSGCAQWAVHSCKNFADAFFTKIGVTPHYQIAKFDKNSAA